MDTIEERQVADFHSLVVADAAREARTVCLYSTPVNNHGCRGAEVSVLVGTDNIGTVVNGLQCSSCWQVGHDTDSSPIALGTRVALPEGYTWQAAAIPVGRSHNECVQDQDDPRPDCTAVGPWDLVRMVA